MFNVNYLFIFLPVKANIIIVHSTLSISSHSPFHSHYNNMYNNIYNDTVVIFLVH